MEKNIMLNENIFWIGKIDDRDVPFHRLTLTKGTTYNSYLLNTEKPTVIDTVDISFGKEFVDNLENIIELDKIKYIVINHTEPDHSGSLRSLASKAKNAVIVCTKPAVNELKEMYKLHDREFLIVRDGDTLDIGGKTLKFIETPYLHTEETMITYCEEDKILFPCDIFSTHVANYEYFNDLAKEDIIGDFIGYYKLIMHPHRRYVQNMIEKIEDLDIKMIAPSHGFVLRENVQSFIDIYDNMSKNAETSKKALILYSTMTGNTKKIADILKEKFEEQNIASKVINVNKTPKEEVIAAINEADAIFFGSSTKYGDMIGNMEDILKNLKSLDLESKLGVAFGSFGWSGESIEVVQDYLNETDLKVLSTSDVIKSTGMIDVEFPLRIRFSPNEDSLIKIERSVTYISDLLLSGI
ncbi:FprA family A-type flavoprotein [Clostridium saccharobutylicum]|uniref:Anaerobic nitric oxide reductase flavorubredoxin NorV n=1 Tax=Clostridium saccharobutylicum DSM 13864 TaxID=1345695 RepID=U5MZ13_CLOSA|nr:FprA family A-type flavoprotein [Clostridium saccharobutylicum]AGX44757.1 anaerobic nitric oxide reductase flavorubredoxin NorV [Clostridium saccharobutylicum DSM 13864]AQR92043.1 anaerobic nitric oxide reductase flavorubredoxin [Clostridium saccharobutylicum]AQS01945.1 anaerobic nitric oxide reductase flavorubredoxin [Clostridium saccharobutylicum]AQS11547.1 anaerobic nitric oxide reductase flavorubredoxin [Clostridium saccharobutylicum]AQS15928.1 anaerobic nitric oxide reductase flavorubr